MGRLMPSLTRRGELMLTDRRQQQAIRDKMAGLQNGFNPAHLTPPYDAIWDALDRCDGDEYLIEHELLRLEKYGLQDTIEAIREHSPGQKRRYISLAERSDEILDVKWFWPSWIPRGLLTVLAADAGVGKTNVALDICHRCIGREIAPDGASMHSKTGNIIYVDAEDFERVINKRLKALETNRRQFYLVPKPERDILDLNRQHHQDELLDMCYDLRPDVIVIDSLSTITVNGENNTEDIRGVLGFLSTLTKEYDCATIIVHHLRKPGQNSGGRPVTMHDLRGSSHLIAMARSIIGLYIAADDPNGPRRMTVLKTNLCKHPPPMAFRYVPTQIDPAVPSVAYQAVNQPVLDDDTITGQCAEWLLDALAAGPRSYADLVDEANELGYSQTNVQRARKKLDWQVIDTLGPQKKGNEWTLAPSLTDEDSKKLSHALMLHEIGGGSKNQGGGLSHAACVHEIGVNDNGVLNNGKNGKISQNGTIGSHGGEQNSDLGPRVPWLPGRRRPYRRRPATINGGGLNAGHRLYAKRHRAAQVGSARGRYRWPPRPIQRSTLGPAPAAPHRGPGAAHQIKSRR